MKFGKLHLLPNSAHQQNYMTVPLIYSHESYMNDCVSDKCDLKEPQDLFRLKVLEIKLLIHSKNQLCFLFWFYFAFLMWVNLPLITEFKINECTKKCNRIAEKWN